MKEGMKKNGEAPQIWGALRNMCYNSNGGGGALKNRGSPKRVSKITDLGGPPNKTLQGAPAPTALYSSQATRVNIYQHGILPPKIIRDSK